MKIQLTAKETVKLSAARGLIKSMVQKLPFSAFALESSKAVDNRFTVNPDGSSEFEIHEKSFVAFLDHGSEMFVKVCGVVQTAGLGIVGAWKEFDEGLSDVKATLLKRNQGFITQAEIDQEMNELYAKMNDELAAARKPNPGQMCPSQVQALKDMLFDNGLSAIAKVQTKDKPRIKVVSSASESIPYSVRLLAAIRLVKDGHSSSTEAATTFGVKEEDIVKSFPA